jgi:hypothetical protein
MRVDAPAFLCIGQVPNTDKSCVYDGGELGSTGGIVDVEITVVTYDRQSTKLNANDNFAPSEFALVA